MQKLIFLSLFTVLFSCTEKKKESTVLLEQETKETSSSDLVEKDKVHKASLEEESAKQFYPIGTDSIIEKSETKAGNTLAQIHKIHKSAPFHLKIEETEYYIVSDRKWYSGIERFRSGIKYGLINDSLELLLDKQFSKIYNPNLTILDCFELKQNHKVGLFNYKTNQLLKPQFDYILPARNGINSEAYGFKRNKWYKIEASRLDSISEADFDPLPILKTLSFDIRNIGKNIMFNTYNVDYEGKGIIISPSFVEYFDFFPAEYFGNVISEGQKNIDFGLEDAFIDVQLKKSIKDRLIAFFVSVYESGINARGYQQESMNLLIYDKESMNINSAYLGSSDNYGEYCNNSGYHFINDTIVEVKANHPQNSGSERLYDFEPNYNYLKIRSDGTTSKLVSNRHFDFTKFIEIDRFYFKGCYASYMSDEERDDQSNIWVSDHLSIQDLDIMRNEIFADYGYKFKTEKWQRYFAKKAWYNPRHDDVNDQLTEIDKTNIKIILEIKELMLEQGEHSFTQKRQSAYHAAG